jgi:hypothetical protein
MSPGLNDSAPSSHMPPVFDYSTTSVYNLSSGGSPSAVAFITPYLVDVGFRSETLETLRPLQPATRQTADEHGDTESIPAKPRQVSIKAI